MDLNGANLEHARDHNQRVTLQAIRLNGPLSRADLAELTGLTLPSIANITKRLLAAGLITEETLRAGARGQPAKRIAINADGGVALGINIDRDHVSLALIDLSGAVRAAVSEDINYPAPDDVLALVMHHLPLLLKQAGITRKKLIGAGVAIPDEFGALELPQTGSARFEAWAVTDIRSLLSEKLKLSIFTENDATSAALGELQFGLGPRETDFFYTFIGIGLGGGLVLDGRPYRGARGRSGELGFMPVMTDNPREKFLADIVSLNVLYRRLAHKGATIKSHSDLATLSDAQRVIADDWMDGAATQLARAFVSVACITDPKTFYLGGRLPKPMLAALAEKIKTRLPKLMRNAPDVRVASRAEDAAVLGAAVLPIAALLLPAERQI